MFESNPELSVSENCIFYEGENCLKTIAIMTSQTQNFLIFWLLILDSKSFQIIF